MKKWMIMSILIMMILLIGCSTDQIPPKIERTYPFANQTYELTTIEKLINEKVNIENANVDAYVVDIFSCPTCPKGALCELCSAEFIIISDTQDYSQKYNLQIDINFRTAKQFEEGKKYRFSIKYRLERNVVYQTESKVIELVGYDELLE